MELLDWFHNTMGGEFVWTMLVSMVPVLELRAGIPFGAALGLPPWACYLAAIIGNLIPVPFIVVYIRRVFLWVRKKLPRFNSLVDALERKAHLKGEKVTKYKYLGLAIFVAVPLPGTGAWTGAMAAAFLDMRLKNAMPPIVIGVLAAGAVISVLTFGIASLF